MVSKLRKKSILNVVDTFKWTALHYAARNGHLRMVRRLVREGADPNALTAHGQSPLHFLARLDPADNHKFEAAYLQTLKVGDTAFTYPTYSFDLLVNVGIN